MVKGLEKFKKYFEEYKDQYVLIGGAACDIAFENSNVSFRATRDLDVVLILEALTPEFGDRFWSFVSDGKYRNKSTNNEKPQFYRFDKPENDEYPKMIELFCRNEYKLHEMGGITPIHISDEISSLSAILLNDDYYKVLIKGKTVVDNLSILRPEYLILLKARAYLDLRSRKENGEGVNSDDIKKHKKDVLRIAAELVIENVYNLPETVKSDIDTFICLLEEEPFDNNSLKEYGLSNSEVVNVLKEKFK